MLTLEQLADFEVCVQDQTLITLDIEGIDLSRIGTIELISVGIEMGDGLTRAFLFDASEGVRRSELHLAQVSILKPILENEQIIKIIHDCRQDSDVLFNHLGIKLVNVFDTFVWNMVMSGVSSRMNLNDTLTAFGCAINDDRVRMKDIYKINPRFWSLRPVTSDMISYAAGDVSVLFDLYRAMHLKVESNPEQQEIAEKNCVEALGSFRDCQFYAILNIPADQRGKVIGRGGCNILKIEKATGGWITSKSEGFLILAPNKKQLAALKKRVLRCVDV